MNKCGRQKSGDTVPLDCNEFLRNLKKKFPKKPILTQIGTFLLDYITQFCSQECLSKNSFLMFCLTCNLFNKYAHFSLIFMSLFGHSGTGEKFVSLLIKHYILDVRSIKCLNNTKNQLNLTDFYWQYFSQPLLNFNEF